MGRMQQAALAPRALAARCGRLCALVLRIESDVLFNSGEVWVEIPETSCVLFPAEGSDWS